LYYANGFEKKLFYCGVITLFRSYHLWTDAILPFYKQLNINQKQLQHPQYFPFLTF